LPNYCINDLECYTYAAKPRFINRAVGKIYQMMYKWHHVTAADIEAGVKFMKKAKKNTISHILYLEQNIYLLNNITTANKTLTATIHLPISQWEEKNLNLLNRLDSVVILYKEEVNKFSKYINKDKIHIIKHGVDVDFFKPGEINKINKNKVLFVGHYLRNFEMLLQVYRIIIEEISSDIEFHFIIPGQFRDRIPVIKELSAKNNIYFYEKLSDEELLEHYQTSYVLLMPMEDSGANTAIVQAIATGLPIITTDIGGIRSYGGGDIFPVIPNNNSVEMAELFKNYYCNASYREEISKKQRSYALMNLEWNSIAKDHLSLYQSLNFD
jgi:glycosyltransferase involved in cell wall biosynthesis